MLSYIVGLSISVLMLVGQFNTKAESVGLGNHILEEGKVTLAAGSKVVTTKEGLEEYKKSFADACDVDFDPVGNIILHYKSQGTIKDKGCTIGGDYKLIKYPSPITTNTSTDSNSSTTTTSSTTSTTYSVTPISSTTTKESPPPPKETSTTNNPTKATEAEETKNTEMKEDDKEGETGNKDENGDNDDIYA
uniref:Uncharacterized protein n=1 Tax=Meloidogyne floridensis TaxID=298350 RepID=A0A915NWH2_9BILA